MTFLGELRVLLVVLLDDVRHFLAMRGKASPCLTCDARSYVVNGKRLWTGGDRRCLHETEMMMERRVVEMLRRAGNFG